MQKRNMFTSIIEGKKNSQQYYLYLLILLLMLLTIVACGGQVAIEAIETEEPSISAIQLFSNRDDSQILFTINKALLTDNSLDCFQNQEATSYLCESIAVLEDSENIYAIQNQNQFLNNFMSVNPGNIPENLPAALSSDFAQGLDFPAATCFTSIEEGIEKAFIIINYAKLNESQLPNASCGEGVCVGPMNGPCFNTIGNIPVTPYPFN